MNEKIFLSKDMIFWGSFAFSIVVCIYIGYSLISGSKRVRERAESNDSDSFKKYSETTAQFMHFLGIVMFFIIFLAIVAVLDS